MQCVCKDPSEEVDGSNYDMLSTRARRMTEELIKISMQVPILVEGFRSAPVPVKCNVTSNNDEQE